MRVGERIGGERDRDDGGHWTDDLLLFKIGSDLPHSLFVFFDYFVRWECP